MTLWETEDESVAVRTNLPTPSDTPYRTPSGTSKTSRRSSRQKSLSPGRSSSPAVPNGDMLGKRGSRDISNDETISILDPRRFTPTLHANLVAEILNLRRDQEEKTKLIESLETSLHESRGEVEEFATTLTKTAKEGRSLKRQLALLEGGTSSALSELARERDEALDRIADNKKHLETAQRKIRAQEEDSNRVHELWANEKEAWEAERRRFERQVHIAEARLKTVLEVAAFQSTGQQQTPNSDSDHDDHARDAVAVNDSDAASIRTMSITNSIRFSALTGPNGGSKLNGMSLADELNFDEEDDDILNDMDGRESIMSMRHKRTLSRESVMSKASRAHGRNQSVESLVAPGSVSRGRLLANQASLAKLEGTISEDDERPRFDRSIYVDTGVQYSPPPSPQLKPTVLQEIPAEKLNRAQDLEVDENREIEANQRRKRVHLSQPLTVEPRAVGAQGLDDPLSPPRTPVSPTRTAPLPPALRPVSAIMISSSTQTDVEVAIEKKFESLPMLIPSISIHPPTSRPSTPRKPMLPQLSKDAGCQVSMQAAAQYTSISVQTEEIRVDERVKLLPPHLQPSSIVSAPPSPSLSMRGPEPFTPGAPPPPRNPKRILSNGSSRMPSSPTELPSIEVRDSYPGNNDDGALSPGAGSIRRPRRISSLFAGFDASSDDADDFADGDLSDSDFKTALSAPRPKGVLNKIKRNSAPRSVPEGVEPESDPGKKAGKDTIDELDETPQSPDEPFSPTQRHSLKPAARQPEKVSPGVATVKAGIMRRAALISSGVAAHSSRARSPSLPESSTEPPFPIPTRASSRRAPISASAPSDGRGSPSSKGSDWWSHSRQNSRTVYRANSIRKSRSAAALPASGRNRRHGSRSPPRSPSEHYGSPRLPAMPQNDITSPRFPDTPSTKRFSHRNQLSVTTVQSSNTAAYSGGGSVQATSVVDAIAQTMVGEWMFKYVRRRKSFGVSESTAFEGENGSNGVRHKRWVWLAPYERAVMWSSKQPTSGSALMGKSGRKLTIQSVLDVKDDTPAPKGVTSLFNRSILILTPARALKFTATSAERHYIWLTALSFLAHSTQEVPEMSTLQPPLPQIGPDFAKQLQQQTHFDMATPPPAGANKLRRNVRDSIRIAKSKGGAPFGPSGRATPTARVPQLPSQDGSYRTNGNTYQQSLVHSLRSAPSNVESFYVEPIVPEAASPPIVPRFVDRGDRGERGYPSVNTHGRKRSSTGPRVPPPLSFRGFSEKGPTPGATGGTTGGFSQSTGQIPTMGTFNGYGNGNGQGAATGFVNHAPSSSTAGMSINTNASSDIYSGHNPSVNLSISQNSTSQSQSQRSSTYGNGPTSVTSASIGHAPSGPPSVRSSDASGRPMQVMSNFFDAVGTVRMEAFISPLGSASPGADRWGGGSVGSKFDNFPEEDIVIEDRFGINGMGGAGGGVGISNTRGYSGSGSHYANKRRSREYPVGGQVRSRSRRRSRESVKFGAVKAGSVASAVSGSATTYNNSANGSYDANRRQRSRNRSQNRDRERGERNRSDSEHFGAMTGIPRGTEDEFVQRRERGRGLVDDPFKGF